jgi:hypothetical protein
MTLPDAVSTMANVDAFVDLPDGSTWALTIFTVDEVRRLLARWKETGEEADGSYFWVVDQLIVPVPGISAMTAAIRELVHSGDITRVGVRCDDRDPDAALCSTMPLPAGRRHPYRGSVGLPRLAASIDFGSTRRLAPAPPRTVEPMDSTTGSLVRHAGAYYRSPASGRRASQTTGATTRVRA